MQTEPTSRHLSGITELSCLMPLKPGFVEALDTRTYATRARIVMKVLNDLRKSAREQRLRRPLVDLVDAAGPIHAFSIGLVNDRQLMLSVTFDQAWEPYMRTVWAELGPLLDLLTCHCEGADAHLSAHGFDRFSEYLRRHQVEMGMFYVESPMSVFDNRYLRSVERLQREGTGEEGAMGAIVPDPAWQAAAEANADPAEAQAQALLALRALYGLRELFPPAHEAEVLRRASAALLPRLLDHPPVTPEHPLFKELTWLRTAPPARAPRASRPAPSPADVQGGILEPYRKLTHGALLLFRVIDPVRARACLETWRPTITTQERRPPGSICRNLAFTFSGLKALGVAPAELAALPKEFREGMEARAGLIGDVRSNHPANWTFPEWNRNRPEMQVSGADDPAPHVRTSTIDLVLDLRLAEEWNDTAPLPDRLARLIDEIDHQAREGGLRLLSVQPMRNRFRSEANVHRGVLDHFGFTEGISQPRPGAPAGPGRYDDAVLLGELLFGHANSRDDAPASGTIPVLLDNGTFLVVRKLRQDVKALHDALAGHEAGGGGDGTHTPAMDDLLARMVGRRRDGEPLAARDPGAGPNDFTFAADADGLRCPVHAHIRRVNPRTGKVPRIVRCGMSFGPDFTAETAGHDRGLMFMAYNASIAEQFEVLHRWLTGGNGRSAFAGQPDPLLGVPEPGQTRMFRYVDNGVVRRINLGDRPFVTLEWGMYLFVPSMTALAHIARGPRASGTAEDARAKAGETIVASLRTAGHWAAALEDLSANRAGVTSAIHAAIRKRGGVLDTQTEYGVIAASREAALETLSNDRAFAVSEYAHRMEGSIGLIYLGRDSHDPQYAQQSAAPNEAIGSIDRRDAFAAAHAVTSKLVTASPAQPRGPVMLSLEDVADGVLAELSQRWIGIPDGVFVAKGGRPASGAAAEAHCPYHFLAPSRYIFSSPLARDAVAEIGRMHGTLVRRKVGELVDSLRGTGRRLEAPLAAPLFDAPIDSGTLASALVGVLEGFLPTVYGNFLKTMNLWISDESLWRIQQDLLTEAPPGSPDLFGATERVLHGPMLRAMQERPVPDMIYRTAREDATLGGTAIARGRPVVVAIASVTEDARQQGDPDVSIVFGGRRSDSGRPPHACPGYEMGLGVLMGMFAGVLGAGALKPAPHPYLVLEPAPLRELQTT